MGREVADSDQEINPKSPEGNSEVKDVGCTSEALQAEAESNLDLEPTSETAAVENTRTKSTHRKPSNATLDKEVCDSPTEVESPVSPIASNAKSSGSAKKSELNRQISTAQGKENVQAFFEGKKKVDKDLLSKILYEKLFATLKQPAGCNSGVNIFQ